LTYGLSARCQYIGLCEGCYIARTCTLGSLAPVAEIDEPPPSEAVARSAASERKREPNEPNGVCVFVCRSARFDIAGWGEYDCYTSRDSRLIRIRTGPNPGQLPNKGSCRAADSRLKAESPDALNSPIVSLTESPDALNSPIVSHIEMPGVEYIVDSELVGREVWISAFRCAQWQERAYHWQMSHEATTPAVFYTVDGR
jgi:hypothetical protein